MNKSKFYIYAGILLLVASVCAPSKLYASNELAKVSKSTNITVDSTELEPFSLNQKTESDERIQFYNDGEMVAGFNEDGDPQIGKRF